MKNISFEEYRKQRAPIICFALSIASVYSIGHVVKVQADDYIFSNSFFSIEIVLLIAFYMIISKALKIKDKKVFIFSCLFGWLFSLSIVTGVELYMNEGLLTGFHNNATRFIMTTAFSPIIISIIALFIETVPLINTKLKKLSIETYFSLSNFSNRKLFLIVWAIIFISFIPAFLAYYPGLYCYDAPEQLNQVLSHNMSTHHPLIHTWYFYFCIRIGGLLISDNFGFALYTLSQMVILSAALAYIFPIMRKLKAPAVLMIFSLGLIVFLPYNAILAISSTKDIIFTALCIFVFLLVIQAIVFTEEFMRNFKMPIALVVCAVLMALFRNNGIYAFAVLVPFFIFALKKHRIFATAICFSIFFIFLLSSKWLVIVSNASDGSIREALSVPIQQVSRVYCLRNDELSEEDKTAIVELIPDADKYDPYIADPTKNSFVDSVFEENKAFYAKLWLELLFQFTEEYISAFLYNNMDMWYTDVNYPSVDPYLETEYHTNNTSTIYENPILPALQKYYDSFANRSSLQYIPIVSAFCNPAVMTWLMFFTMGICLLYKRYDFLIPIIFMFGLWGTVMLAPVILMRYAYPFFCCMPIYFTFILEAIKKQNTIPD